MLDVIEGYFGDGRVLNLEISYFADPYPLGTGGAIRHSLQHITGSQFLVLNGDSYCDFDTEALIRTHFVSRSAAIIWTARVENSHRFGSLDVAEDRGVLAFHEKQASHGPGVVNAGVYLVERDVVTAIPEYRAVSSESEVFPRLVSNGLNAAAGNTPFLDIGTPESFGMAEEFLPRTYNREALKIDH